MLLYQGSKDPLVPVTQAYRRADELTKAGIPGRVEILLGQGHGWGGEEVVRTGEQAVAFLDKTLRRAQRTAAAAK